MHLDRTGICRSRWGGVQAPPLPSLDQTFGAFAMRIDIPSNVPSTSPQTLLQDLGSSTPCCEAILKTGRFSFFT